MIPIGTEISVATPVITSVPTIACSAPPPAPITPARGLGEERAVEARRPALDHLVEQGEQRQRPRRRSRRRFRASRDGPSPAARPSAIRDQMYAVGSASRAVRMKSRTIVKLPVASSMASAISADPATTARRNQPRQGPAADGGPAERRRRARPDRTRPPGSRLVVGRPSWLLLDVRAGDDQAGDHVDDQGDAEQDEPRGDQGVDVDSRGLREPERDVGRDRRRVLLADQVEGDDPRDREDDRRPPSSRRAPDRARASSR